MSQPDFADVWSADKQFFPDAGDSGCLDSSEMQILSAEAQALLAELNQVRSLEHERLTRIHHLEQALDQALSCLDDLRLRVQNQRLLEAQLFKTEEFACVQQQAIARLKQQLQRQQHALYIREQLILGLVSIARVVPLTEQYEVGHAHQTPQVESNYPKQLTLDLNIGLPETPFVNPLKEQLQVARQRIQELSMYIAQLEVQLQWAAASLAEQQVLEVTLRQAKTLVTERNSAITALQKDLAIAQVKVEELEIQLAKQSKIQAKWQQNCQELELEREQYRARVSALEQEVVEMQEQIFRQARQAIEYETAVQHWKDRYSAVQHKTIQLKELLELVLPEASAKGANTEAIDTALPPALLDMLEMLQLLVFDQEQESSESSVVPSPRFNMLDLPDFLIRRRSYRAR